VRSVPSVTRPAGPPGPEERRALSRVRLLPRSLPG
jgi:hypothetical protein